MEPIQVCAVISVPTRMGFSYLPTFTVMYTILQIVISVAVIYLIFSVIVYVAVEWIAGLFQIRGKMLKTAILKLFKDQRIGEAVYCHPNVECLKPHGKRLSSYIPATNIALALIDTIGAKANPDVASRMSDPYKNFVEGVTNTAEGDHKILLATLGQQAKNVKGLAASIEKWFDSSMDRLTGLYKRRMRLIVFLVAATVTVSFNVDTIHIILAAKADPALRQRLNDLGDKLLADSVVTQIIEQGSDLDYYEDYVNDSSITVSDSIGLETEDEHAPLEKTIASHQDKRLDQLLYMNQLVRDSDFPIGWPIEKDITWPYIILGWLLTAVALTAGAPFWFDMLKKLVNIRSAGPKPDTSTKNSA